MDRDFDIVAKKQTSVWFFANIPINDRKIQHHRIVDWKIQLKSGGAGVCTFGTSIFPLVSIFYHVENTTVAVVSHFK